MDQSGPQEVTLLLQKFADGDRDVAGRLMELIYDALHDLARRHLRRERRDHTLQPTALVHEAWLRLVGQQRASFESRAHFLSVASEAIRRILVDHARARSRRKRGGDQVRVTLSDEIGGAGSTEDADLLDLDRALDALQTEDETDHRIVVLRFFGGLTVEEIAEVLAMSTRTVRRRWAFARAWLHRRLLEPES